MTSKTWAFLSKSLCSKYSISANHPKCSGLKKISIYYHSLVSEEVGKSAGKLFWSILGSLMHQHSALLILVGLSHLGGWLAVGWPEILSQLRQLALLLSLPLLAGQPRCCNRVSRSRQSLLRPKLTTGNLSLLPHSIGCDKLQVQPRLKSCADRLHVFMLQLESHNPKGVDKEARIIGTIIVIRLPHVDILHFSKNILNEFNLS